MADGAIVPAGAAALIASFDPLDPFDPLGWPAAPDPQRKLFLSDTNDSLFALIDAQDWDWIRANRWHCKSDGRTKRYVCRQQRLHGGKRSIYLHIEVMRVAGVIQPSPAHVLVDHLDGNGLNCCRSNLRWATPSENSMNLYGYASKQRILEYVNE
jgi:hypothetical protein